MKKMEKDTLKLDELDLIEGDWLLLERGNDEDFPNFNFTNLLHLVIPPFMLTRFKLWGERRNVYVDEIKLATPTQERIARVSTRIGIRSPEQVQDILIPKIENGEFWDYFPLRNIYKGTERICEALKSSKGFELYVPWLGSQL